MSVAQSQRFRIPSHYYVYCDPPDKEGDEALHFISPNRRVKLKGHAFREFVQHVAPMLDGLHSFDDIYDQVRDLFTAEDLASCLQLLTQNAVLEDASQWGLSETVQAQLRPQLNLFHDLSEQPWALQERIARARVTIFGLTGAGVAAARSLAAAGIGTLRCVDDATVGTTDLYFSSEFAHEDEGALRCEALRQRLCARRGAPAFEAVTAHPESDGAMDEAVAGSDFILNCIDEGNVSLAYRLNRACLRTRTPWISAAASGFEAIVGPTVYPGETACYLCYRMRIVACASDPEAGFDFESFLDRRKSDDSGRRANLVFGPALAAQIAGAEALKALSGFGPVATRGRIQVFDLRDLNSTFHVVLRKPWCPACFANWDQAPGA